MKITDIKTRLELYELAEIWYNRMQLLSDICDDESQTFKKRRKAFILWLTMYHRVMNLQKMLIEAEKPKPNANMKSGGH